ncbi:hypothetical protein QO207_30930 [Pseudomonas sp. CAN2814]|uniref:hypothetical protein n=1 Tax=Pseudomonas sp. CAN1 TaxID=3046726 RepID=UPI002649DB21|nr:hypothetical protein [Pseudomonas sp. CAN1]MDN6861028.1 hypothetical protein [Pseudomonas sp. CAN1]
MWRTLRILGRATPEQIAAQVAATGTKVLASSVQRYFRDLKNAGYLERDGRYYILTPKRYTGPRPPMVQRTEIRQVYDPNLDKVVWVSGEEEAQPECQELTWLRIEREQLQEQLELLQATVACYRADAERYRHIVNVLGMGISLPGSCSVTKTAEETNAALDALIAEEAMKRACA